MIRSRRESKFNPQQQLHPLSCAAFLRRVKDTLRWLISAAAISSGPEQLGAIAFEKKTFDSVRV